MECIYCGSSTRVTRTISKGTRVERRRECLECSAKFWTEEMAIPSDILVEKRGNKPPEAFDPEKLRRSIDLACNKLPVTPQQKKEIMRTVMELITHRADVEHRIVPSAEIGQAVLRELKEKNITAWSRYSSYYHGDRHLDEVASFLAQNSAPTKASNDSRIEALLEDVEDLKRRIIENKEKSDVPED